MGKSSTFPRQRRLRVLILIRPDPLWKTSTSSHTWIRVVLLLLGRIGHVLLLLLLLIWVVIIRIVLLLRSIWISLRWWWVTHRRWCRMIVRWSLWFIHGYLIWNHNHIFYGAERQKKSSLKAWDFWKETLSLSSTSSPNQADNNENGDNQDDPNKVRSTTESATEIHQWWKWQKRIDPEQTWFFLVCSRTVCHMNHSKILLRRENHPMGSGTFRRRCHWDLHYWNRCLPLEKRQSWLRATIRRRSPPSWGKLPNKEDHHIREKRCRLPP